MYRYKNKTDQQLTIVGVGIIKPGEEFKARRLIESANLEVLGGPDDTSESIVGKQAPQPGAITEADRVGDVPTDTNNQEGI